MWKCKQVHELLSFLRSFGLLPMPFQTIIFIALVVFPSWVWSRNYWRLLNTWSLTLYGTWAWLGTPVFSKNGWIFQKFSYSPPAPFSRTNVAIFPKKLDWKWPPSPAPPFEKFPKNHPFWRRQASLREGFQEKNPYFLWFFAKPGWGGPRVGLAKDHKKIRDFFRNPFLYLGTR